MQAQIDWGGAALMAAMLSAVLLAVAQANTWGWTSSRTLGLLGAGAVLLVAFVAFERRAPEPMVDMKLMAQRPVWSTNLAAFAVGFAMFGSYILIPQLVELPARTGYGFARTATVAGLVMLPAPW